MKEFKEFISRGSVIDLALGIVIGAAFTAVVNSFVRDVLTGVIGAIVGKPNFNDLSVALGQGVVVYGRFITAAINFAPKPAPVAPRDDPACSITAVATRSSEAN